MKTMILLDHVGFSEQNYDIIKEVNSFVLDSLEEVSIAVNDVSTKVIEVNTAVSNVAEIGCFQDGVLIATNIINADQLLSAHTSAKKVLYLWDVDWLHRAFNYELLYDILSDERLNIIVRSEEHKKALKTLCGREPLGILQNFNLEKIWTLLS
tara:strand:- start:1836 stop:2294 length:459 start_codon:yes stop_codon:yes gene_type:complete